MKEIKERPGWKQQLFPMDSWINSSSSRWWAGLLSSRKGMNCSGNYILIREQWCITKYKGSAQKLLRRKKCLLKNVFISGSSQILAVLSHFSCGSRSRITPRLAHVAFTWQRAKSSTQDSLLLTPEVLLCHKTLWRPNATLHKLLSFNIHFTRSNPFSV